MMRRFSLFVGMIGLTLVASGLLFAQEAEEEQAEYGWQKELVGGLNFSQTAFDNWAQGGENTLA